MNPAPTLLNDFLTPAFVWAVVATFTAGVVLWMATERLKMWWVSRGGEPRPYDDTPPAYDDTCGIEDCTRPGLVPFNTTSGVLFVCRRHSGEVGDWVGHDNRVYDQDLDPVTDLSQWEKEMPA